MAFLLDGPSVLEELDASGSPRTNYLTHPGVLDEIVSFGRAGSNYYPLTDVLGSIYAIADSTGGIVRRNSYDVYGERTPSGGAGPELTFGYTGREHDAAMLLYYRDRYRDPRSGGWIQRDRFDPAQIGREIGRFNPKLATSVVQRLWPTIPGMPAQVMNQYGYVMQNPAMYSDPMGQLVWLLPLLVGVLIAGLVNWLLGLLVDATAPLGEEAASWYADRLNDCSNSPGQTILYWIGGLFASLWTKDTAKITFNVLFFVYALRNIFWWMADNTAASTLIDWGALFRLEAHYLGRAGKAGRDIYLHIDALWGLIRHWPYNL